MQAKGRGTLKLKAQSSLYHQTWAHFMILFEFSAFQTKSDWKYVAMVIDRVLLYIFFGVTLGGTLGILLSAPNVFDPVTDQSVTINRLKELYSGNLDN